MRKSGAGMPTLPGTWYKCALILFYIKICVSKRTTEGWNAVKNWPAGPGDLFASLGWYFFFLCLYQESYPASDSSSLHYLVVLLSLTPFQVQPHPFLSLSDDNYTASELLSLPREVTMSEVLHSYCSYLILAFGWKLDINSKCISNPSALKLRCTTAFTLIHRPTWNSNTLSTFDVIYFRCVFSQSIDRRDD